MLRRCISKQSLCQMFIRRQHGIAGQVKPGAISSVQIIDDVLPSVKIDYEDGIKHTFAAIHLRDCCRCPQCFDGDSSQQRLFDITAEVPLNVKPSTVSIVHDGNLKIQWPDGHLSFFTSERLAELIKPRTKRELEFLDCNFIPDKFKFEDVINDNKAMKECLVNVKEKGLCLLEEVPQEEGQLHRIGHVVSHLRVTSYGPTFQVKNKLNPSNLAYTSGNLSFHTDLTYYQNIPGIQMLHCIKPATQGGANIFSDGFKISEFLRQNKIESFKELCKNFWEFFDIATEHGRQYHMKSRDSVIGLDNIGNYTHFRHNCHSRCDLHTDSRTEIHNMYKALYDVSETLRRPEMKLRLRLEAGQCAIFNNLRVLHAREEYVDTKGQRFLEGGYVDWDEVNSFIRVN